MLPCIIGNISLSITLKGLARFRCVKRCTPVSRFKPTELCYNFQRLYFNDGKTTTTIMNDENDAPLMINSYSTAGFRLNNGFYVIGPMAIFSNTVLQWNVGNIDQATEEAFSLFYTLEPKLAILIIGVGEPHEKLKTNVRHSLARRNLSVEVLPTYQACTTFNFLNAEGRMVAGVMIPPRVLRTVQEELLISAKKTTTSDIVKLSEHL